MENNVIFAKVIDRHSKFKPATAYLQKEVEELITKLSEESELTKEQIRAMWVSQFRMISAVIKQCKSKNDEDFDINTYKSIRLPYLGRFEVKKTFKKKYENNS